MSICAASSTRTESLPRQYPRRFIGAMPFNITRVAFREMREEYYVSEKTDGVRYMLLITKDGAFLITRKFDFLYIVGGDTLVKYFASKGIDFFCYYSVYSTSHHIILFLFYFIIIII